MKSKVKTLLKYIVFFILANAVIIAVIFVNSWFSEKRFESRLLYSIQFNLSQLHPGTAPVPKKFHKDILSVLKSAGFGDLIGPNLASAALVISTNRYDDLIVFWAEQSFSEDAVELKFSEQVDSLTVPISEFDAKINKKDNARGVVFGASFRWDKGTEGWKTINQTTDTNAQIRLLTDGKPQTPWLHVDVYNLDKDTFTNANIDTLF
jgi:hypothetical protein